MSWATTSGPGRIPIPWESTFERLRVLLQEAPGTGKSWTIRLLLNEAPVAGVELKLEGATVEAIWRGKLKLNELDTLSLEIIPSGEPAASSAGVGTIIESEIGAPGNMFFLPAGGNGNLSRTATGYNCPFAVNSAAWSETEGGMRLIVPGSYKLRALAADLSGTAGAAKSYALSARVNRSKDVLTAKVEGASATQALAKGEQQLEVGQSLELKSVPSGEPTIRNCRTCLAVESEAEGELFWGGTVGSTYSPTAERFAPTDGYQEGWAAGGETRRRPPNMAISKLYAEIDTQPGGGKSLTFGFKVLTVKQPIEFKISGESKTGSDTAHNFTTGNSGINIYVTPTGEPAAGRAFWGYAFKFPQPVELEASPSGSGSISADLRGVASLESSPTGFGATSGALGTVASMQAQPVGQGAAAGALGTVASMEAAPTGIGSVAASLGAVANLAAEPSGQGSIAAGLQGIASMEGNPSGTGGVEGSLSAVASLEAQLQGQGSAIGELGVVASMEAAPAGVGSIDAELRAVTNLEAVLEGSGSISAELEAIVISHPAQASVRVRPTIAADIRVAPMTAVSVSVRPKVAVAIRVRPANRS